MFSVKFVNFLRTAMLKHQRMADFPVDTRCKLNVYKSFRRRPGRLVNALYTFNLRPVSTGLVNL